MIASVTRIKIGGEYLLNLRGFGNEERVTVTDKIPPKGNGAPGRVWMRSDAWVRDDNPKGVGSITYDQARKWLSVVR